MFRGWRPSLVLTDVDLPIMGGMALIQAVRQEDPDAAVIAMCGGEVAGFLDAKDLRSACLKLGAYALLQRPVRVEDLLLTTEGALYSRQMARSQRQLLERRWGAVRPMAYSCELLAVYGTVLTQMPRDLAYPRHQDRSRPTPGYAAGTKATGLVEPSPGTDTPSAVHSLGRSRPDARGQGWAVRCGWCGLSNRPGTRYCWSCGLLLNARRTARQATQVRSTQETMSAGDSCPTRNPA
jgi:CheY-like chemotaxis protein